MLSSLIRTIAAFGNQWFVVYPCPLPLFLVGAMEYEGAVTLTACFQPAELSRERVQMLLQRVQREIPTDLAAAEAAFVVKEIA